LTLGLTLISITVILITCGLLLAGLLRRRLQVKATRDLIRPLPKDSEFYWRAEVTTATLFVVTVWTMLSLSALSKSPENVSPVAVEALGHPWR
jgi:hypothetical protein